MKLLEEDLTTDKLIEMVHELFHDRVKYVDAMNACTQQDAITSIINLINDFS